MLKNKQALLLSTAAIALVIGGIIAGVWLERSDFMSEHTAAASDTRDTIREDLLDKLGEVAQQDAQNKPSVLDPFADPFSSVFFGTDPFAKLQQMQQQMEQLFGNVGNGSPLPALGSSSGFGGFNAMTQPKIAVEESKDEYRVVISLDKDSHIELQTDLQDNTLSLSAQLRTEQHEQSQGRQMSSSSTSHFSRSIPLAEPVDATGMKTEKTDSSIVISIPKMS